MTRSVPSSSSHPHRLQLRDVFDFKNEIRVRRYSGLRITICAVGEPGRDNDLSNASGLHSHDGGFECRNVDALADDKFQWVPTGLLARVELSAVRQISRIVDLHTSDAADERSSVDLGG